MDEKFEFDVPLFADLTAPLNEDQCYSFFETPMRTPLKKPIKMSNTLENEPMEVETEENAPLSHTEERSQSVNSPDNQASEVCQSLEDKSIDIPNQEDYTDTASKSKNYQPRKSTPRTALKRIDLGQEQPLRQSPRLAAIAKSIRRNNASRGFIEGNKPSSGHHRRSLSEGSAIATQFSKIIKKPLGQRRVLKLGGAHGLNEEEKEALETTTNYKQILSTNRKQSSVLAKKEPTRICPTKPHEFKFATNSRIRSKSTVNEEQQVDFSKSLRTKTSVNKDLPKGPTKCQPFNLHNSSKAKEEVPQPFISIAELNLKFHTQTPQRFRTKRSNGYEPQADSKKGKTESGITIAHTPKLSTRLRSRPIHHPTREEIEMKEIEEAQKCQFKALPINKKILEEPQIPLIEKKKVVTVPEPFDITDTRKMVHTSTNKLFLETYKNLGSTSSLASIPHGGIPAVWEKKSTQIKPFSFDVRDIETLRKKKQKIEAMLEEEKKKANFHAHPMPVFEDGVKGVPQKKLPTPTKVQPFNLISDFRGLTKQQMLQKELEELEALEKEQRIFHAQADTVLHRQPFIPEKSKKPLTDISGFTLNTDKRSEERQAFDMHLKQKEDEMMAKKREDEERQLAEEEAEVARMRKEAVHKAQPIRKYKPIEIRHGVLPPTNPISPELLTKTRLRNKVIPNSTLSTSNTSITSANITSANANSTYTTD